MYRIPVLFHESYYTQFYGAQTSLCHLLDNLDRERFSPWVVFPGEGAVAAKVRARGIPVEIVPLPDPLMVFGGDLLRAPTATKMVRWIQLWPQVWHLVQLIKKHDIALMHCNGPRSVLSSGWAAKLCGIPLLCHMRGYTPTGWLDNVVFALSDRLIPVSRQVVQVLAQNRFARADGKMALVRGGIDLSKFDPSISGRAVRKEFGFSSSDVVVGTVGALDPRKGHHVFLEMAHTVAAEHPQARFLIVGDVSNDQDRAYKQQLLSLGDDLIADGRLILAGWRDDMPAVYAAMDIFVLASFREGLPLAVLESMAMAKPTVRTEAEGVDETTVDGETGFRIPIEDAPAMAAAMATAVAKLVRDRALCQKMGAVALARARLHFSAERMTREIEQIYLDCLNGKKR